jgi:hypothetical protein
VLLRPDVTYPPVPDAPTRLSRGRVAAPGGWRVRLPATPHALDEPRAARGAVGLHVGARELRVRPGAQREPSGRPLLCIHLYNLCNIYIYNITYIHIIHIIHTHIYIYIYIYIYIMGGRPASAPCSGRGVASGGRAPRGFEAARQKFIHHHQ